MNLRYERGVFVESARMQFRLVSRVPFNYVAAAGQPATLLFLTQGALRSAEPEHAERTLLAIGLLCVWGAVVFACGMFLHWDVLTGVLPTTLVTHARPTVVCLGRSVGGAVFAVGAVAVSVVLTAAALRLPMSWHLAQTAAYTVPVATGSAAALGLLISAALIRHREAGRVADALVYPIFIAGGLLIPASLLPAPVWASGNLISLRATYAFGQETAAGDIWPGLAQLGQVLALTLAYVVAGSYILTQQIRKARAG